MPSSSRPWVVAAACLPIVFLALLLALGRSNAQEPRAVTLVDSAYSPQPGESVVDLNQTFAGAKSELDQAPTTGPLTVRIPTSFDGLTLQAASVTASASSRLITARGTSTAWGTEVEVLAIAQWPDDTSGTPTFSLGARVKNPQNFSLTKLNPNWTSPAVKLSTAFVTFATAEQELPDTQNFYLEKKVPAGLAFAGQVKFDSLFGVDAEEAFGIPDYVLTFKGSLTGDISIFTKEEDEPAVQADLHLEATLELPNPPPAEVHTWFTPVDKWKVAIDITAAKNWEFEAAFSGKLDINDPDGDLGLPPGPLDFKATASYATDGSASVKISTTEKDWPAAFKVQKLTIKQASLEFAFKRADTGKVTLSASAKGKFELGPGKEQVDVALTFEKKDKVYSVKLSGALSTAVPFTELTAFLGDVAQDPLNPGAHGELDNLQLTSARLSFGFETDPGKDVKVKYGFTAGVAYKNIGADLLLVVEKKGAEVHFVVGVSPRGSGSALKLGDLDPTLEAPAKDVELPDVALLFGDKALKGGKKELGDEVFNFLLPVYCTKAGDKCDDIKVDLGPGAVIVSSIQIPKELKGVTDSLWIAADQPILLGGSFPLLGQGGTQVNVFAKLPEMAPSCSSQDPAVRAPEWFVRGQLDLTLKLNPSKGSAEFALEGELGVRLRKGEVPAGQEECGNKTDSALYEHLEFQVKAGIELSPKEGLKLTLSGAVTNPDKQVWDQAFGVDWLTVKTLRLELSLEVPPTGAATFGMGFRGAVVIGTKDIDTSFAIELTITAAPPWVVPNFVGFRFASVDGISLYELAALASDVSGQPISVDNLPNVALKRVEFSFSQKDKPELCLPIGLIIGADLYINPTPGYTPPDFTTCNTDGEEESNASVLALQRFAAGSQTVTASQEAASGTIGACGTQEEKDAGCFAGIRIEITDSGVLGRASMGAWTLGPVAFQDALLELILNNTTQSLIVKGGIVIEGVGQGSLAVALKVGSISFLGDVNLYGVFWAHLEGIAAFDLVQPGFQVTGFIKQEIGRRINEQLRPLYQGFGATLSILNGVITDLRDPNKTFDDIGQKIINAPQDLLALGVQSPEWLLWLTDQISQAIDAYEANNGGVGPIGTIINAILQGGTITITDGIPGQFTDPTCLGTWDPSGNGVCWTTLPVPAGSYTVCVIVCWVVNVPAIPGIPGVIVPSFCPGFVIDGDCWTIPPISLELPGICDVWPDALDPYDCDALGLKRKISDSFDEAFFAIFGIDFDEVQLRVQEIADALLDPDFVLIDVPCVGFDVSMGELQGSKNAFLFTVHLVLFGQDYYFNDIGWDFDQSLDWNLNNIATRLRDAFLGTNAGEPGICSEAPAETEPVIAPPSNLQLTAPATVTEGSQVSISGTFDDPDAQAGDAVAVVITWGDGATDTVTPTNRTFTATHTYADDNPTGTSSDTFEISATVNNSRTGTTTAVKDVVVQNANPVLSGVTVSATAINEDGSVTVTGSFTDPGTADTHSLVIAWGDGSSTVPVSEANGSGTFTASHTYRDDNPTGSQSDVYSIVLTLSDDDTGTATATRSVTVNNVAPTLQVSVDTTTVNEGGKVKLSGQLTDTGTLDTHFVTINWGDGSSEQVPLGQGALAFEREHHFLDDNPTATASDNVNISATATDDDGGSATATAAVTVSNVAPYDVTVKFGTLDVYENDSTALVVDFKDPGLNDTFTISIDWGDGQPAATYQVAAGEQHSTVIMHQYLDDNPTGTPSDTFAVAVRVVDDDTGQSSGAVSEIYDPVTKTYSTGAPVVTVRTAAPVVRFSNGGQSTQYSDPLVTPVTIHAFDVRGSAATQPFTESLSIFKTEWKFESGAFQVGLPGKLAIDPSSQSCAEATVPPTPEGNEPAIAAPFQECTWQMQGALDVQPGLYTIRVHVADDDTVVGYYDTTITVLPEDATAYYTGPSFAAAVSAKDGTATVPLRATLRDITSEPQHPAYDPYAGDITDGSGLAHAHVKFVDLANNNAVLCEADARVAFAGDKSIADAFCNWKVTLPKDADSEQYEIGVLVSGWYVGSHDTPVVVTVARPIANFATGGGHLILDGSAGSYAGDDGSHSNFGFGVKFDPKSRKVQGRATVFIRSGGHVYQIKTNRVETLGIVDENGVPRTAQFEGRANLTDVTDPINPVTVGSNLFFQMRMTDLDGSADTIGWTLWNSDGLMLFSSNWDRTATVEQALAGGELSVHGQR